MLNYLLAIIVVGLILDSIVLMKPATVGLVTQFGRRTGRILYEGISVKLPLIERVKVFSLELKTAPIKVDVSAMDEPEEGGVSTQARLEITFVGSVQYRPARYAPGLLTFFEMSEKTIQDGLTDAIKSEVGKIGAVHTAHDMIKMREALELLIDCTLRLEVPPHGEEPTEKRLQFYQDRKPQIRADLNNGISARRGLSLSSVEKRYGIDIETLAVADLDFSDATRRALELRRQEKARMEAAGVQQKTWDEIFNRLKTELGVEKATHVADLAVGRASQRQIVDVQGGALPLVNIGRKE